MRAWVWLAVGSIWILTSGSAFGEVAPVKAMHLKDMMSHPWFWEVTAASGLGWFIGTLKGFSGTKQWLGRYGMTAPKPVVLVVDLVIFIGVGGFFGTAIYNPDTMQAAIAAGMSWPIGLGALTK